MYLGNGVIHKSLQDEMFSLQLEFSWQVTFDWGNFKRSIPGYAEVTLGEGYIEVGIFGFSLGQVLRSMWCKCIMIYLGGFLVLCLGMCLGFCSLMCCNCSGQTTSLCWKRRRETNALLHEKTCRKRSTDRILLSWQPFLNETDAETSN